MRATAGKSGFDLKEDFQGMRVLQRAELGWIMARAEGNITQRFIIE